MSELPTPPNSWQEFETEKPPQVLNSAKYNEMLMIPKKKKGK